MKGALLETLGEALLAAGDAPEGLHALEQALAMREALLAQDPESVRYIRGVASVLRASGEAYVGLEDPASALERLGRAQTLTQTLAERDPTSFQYQRDLSFLYDLQGAILLQAGDRDGALAHYRDGLTIAEALAADDPASAGLQRDLMISLYFVWDVSRDPDYARRAISVAEGLAARGHLSPDDAGVIAALRAEIGE